MSHEGAPFSVLIADDVDDLRFLVRTSLEHTGRFRVVAEAGDGSEAIAQAAIHQPELVLLDLAMPRMDGLEALPAIRAAAPWAKVVVLSGFERSAMSERAAAAGAVGYLEKGLSTDELVDELLAVVSVMEVVESALAEVRASLDADPRSPRAARRFVAETLRRWNCEEQLEVVNLLTTELVANAITHANSDVQVVVRQIGDRLRVEVLDDSEEGPVVKAADALDESGRGMALIDALAGSWGVEPRATGKAVWFELPRFGSKL